MTDESVRGALDALMADLRLPEDETQESPESERKRRSDYQGPRDWKEVARKHGKPVTYRLPAGLAREVKVVAINNDWAISKLVSFLLEHGLAQLDDGTLTLPEGDGWMPKQEHWEDQQG